jgi:site-specific recombinase XerD
VSSPPAPPAPRLELELLPAGFARALEAHRAPVAGEGDPPLSADEVYFAERARAENTRRAYRSDLAHFAQWCQGEGRTPLPAAADTVSGYLIYLAHHGSKVPTMSRRLSSIAYVHRFAGQPNPVDSPRVLSVWEGVRREKAQPVDQAAALMPPVLWKVLDELPDDVSGVRDRALLLVGFVAALRRSELVAIQVGHVGEHPRGRVLAIPKSKTDPYGEGQLVVLPYSSLSAHCPVAALQAWLKAAELEEGFVFRRIHRNGKSVMPLRTRELPDGTRVSLPGMSEAAVNDAVQRACCRALGKEKGMTYSAHSLRAGFATYASQKGASDRAIAHQTRHRSLASLNQYIRIESAWNDNAATALGL